MAHEKLKPTYEFTENKIKALKQIVPEAFEDGKINFDTLRECLGDLVEDSDDERFGLLWPGKKEARRLAAIPSKGTLVPVYGEGLNADGTPDTDGINDSKNIFIEGENLEVLKILQKSYAGRIKMIYIDPPYNTGDDFVYDDNFTEPLEHYLRRTGQIDDEGKSLTTNKKSHGRFHSKWLDMIYPRLKLARELLKDDGVIFISIDDNELEHLQIIMNEIFGDECFIALFIWEKRTNRENRKTISSRHDYILSYCKNGDLLKSSIAQLPMTAEALERYKNPDNDPRGPWKSDPASAQAGHGTKSQFYDLVSPSGKVHKLQSGRCWVYTKEVMSQEIADGKIWFGKTGEGVPRIKTYLDAKERGLTPESIWFAADCSTNEKAKNDIKELFNGEAVFETPKPVELMKRIIEIGGKDELILDFFAGSSSMAAASILNNNASNYIMVQAAEPCSKDSVASKNGFKTISEISIDRIKRTIRNNDAKKGFKVFSYKKSQLWEKWEDNLDELFSDKNEWHKSEILFEIVLNEGFPLDSFLTHKQGHNIITKVSSEWHSYSLQICLDDKIEESTIAEIELGDDVFICFDHAITDQGKLRLSDKGLIKTIG